MHTRTRITHILFLFALLFVTACAPLTPAAPSSAPAGDDTYRRGETSREMPAEEAAPQPYDRSGTQADGASMRNGSAASADDSAREMRPTAPPRKAQYEPVTAGVVDDNAAWADYLDYRERHPWVYANDRDVTERYVIVVQDEDGYAVHDADVTIYVDDVELFHGRSDSGGRLLFHPNALDHANRSQRHIHEFRVVAEKGWVAQSRTFSRYGDESWTLTLTDPPRPDGARLDLLFLVDATGSMDDEIGKLKATMADIADDIARLPEMPDVRYGLVGYRDRGDAFVVRDYDFTPNLDNFQRTLAGLRANGGGDEPEALNQALHTAIHQVSWRDDDTVRMIVLVADAPPHLDYHGEEFSYDQDMFHAVGKGIKIFPVGASGLNADGEFIFRQLAQVTGGKFVFLTYAEGGDPSSGPGVETEHDVENYSVDTLDRLIVRLVREELAALNQPATANAPTRAEQPQSPTSVPQQQQPPVSCTIDLERGRDDCRAIRDVLTEVDPGLWRVNLDPRLSDYRVVRLEIRYNADPIGYSVNVGDSITNNGDSGDYGDQSNDAELQVVDGTLAVYASDHHRDVGQPRLLQEWHSVAGEGATLTLEVADGVAWVNGWGVVESPALFALDGQEDWEGPVNYELYAAFNRTITGERRGIGVESVVVTLIAD